MESKLTTAAWIELNYFSIATLIFSDDFLVRNLKTKNEMSIAIITRLEYAIIYYKGKLRQQTRQQC